MKNQIDTIQNILNKNSKIKRTTTKLNRHVWTVQEEKLALKLYKSNASAETIASEVSNTDFKLSSMQMKLENIKYLDTGTGLANVSSLTRQIFNNNK